VQHTFSKEKIYDISAGATGDLFCPEHSVSQPPVDRRRAEELLDEISLCLIDAPPPLQSDEN